MLRTNLFLPACLAVSSLLIAHPAAAQNDTYLHPLTYTLDDPGLTGWFEFNPTTRTFGSYYITLPDILSDGGTFVIDSSKNVAGQTPINLARFVPDTGSYRYHASMFGFGRTDVDGETESVELYTLGMQYGKTALGQPVLPIDNGIVDDEGNISFSAIYAVDNTGLSNTEALPGGQINVTGPAPVPEASTSVSFGLLLALGMDGVIAAKKKNTKKKAAVA